MVVMVAYLFEYTKTCWIVHFKKVNCMICELYPMKLSTPPKKKKSQQKKTHPNAVRSFRHFIFNTPKAGRPRRPCHSAPVQVLRGLSLPLHCPVLCLPYHWHYHPIMRLTWIFVSWCQEPRGQETELLPGQVLQEAILCALSAETGPGKGTKEWLSGLPGQIPWIQDIGLNLSWNQREKG